MADKEAEDKEKDISNKELPASEVKARELGWKPKDEYSGDPDQWVDHDEFVRRAPLFEGLHKANRTIKRLEKMVETMAQHTEEVKAGAYKQALEDLKKEKKQAAKENDIEKVVALDEKIDHVKAQAEAAKKAPDTSNEVFDEWKEKNAWYNDDEDMFAYANGIGNKLEKDNPDWGPEKVLDEVAKRTKKAFDWKTKNPNREKPSKVGSGSGDDKTPKGKGKLPTYSDLPPEAKEMYNTLVKSKSNPRGVLSPEQYLKDYALKAGTYEESN